MRKNTVYAGVISVWMAWAGVAETPLFTVGPRRHFGGHADTRAPAGTEDGRGTNRLSNVCMILHDTPKPVLTPYR